MEPFLTKLHDKRIILASNSPRRQELLKALGVDFEVKVHPVDETVPTDLPAEYAAAYLSKLKADSFPVPLGENEILITADTIVIVKGRILGKPNSELEAFEMIKSLSGATHTVMTAVTFKDSKRQITVEDEAKVSFRFLEEDEIWYYIRNFKPFDKAGAYGIQEWIGFVGVTSIEGSYFTVMGFPQHLVYQQLKKW
ncbi:MAG: Maf family nucleotide pyrophosphatase [Algoriphagus sp.]|uniref:Maf family nucleotide pyrophosphatase n=1 Tax=Algoriphagus sp. TaxID=1872435 RepID=UPI00271599B6|nr:Maf family nucleotide pyrophosphatase [Algoriphagus sp.]MDO8966254.1 Maf family nucleotide pyrophosphatase [Algoriphagus sp.]MDP2040367.1 Maf family nucleotide pyrophosphatase [Algoriphagus sp.]MDP3201281.1 Maf family nucleotide pyrophosphatase [Algoriphagus sp.]MDP3472823.1 Maf family nucleotide pyrophosphatase [Algoriphagus sp.]